MILPALREDINGVSNDTVETTALITRCCTLNRGNLQLGHGVFDTGTPRRERKPGGLVALESGSPWISTAESGDVDESIASAQSSDNAKAETAISSGKARGAGSSHWSPEMEGPMSVTSAREGVEWRENEGLHCGVVGMRPGDSDNHSQGEVS
ncbi:hypothetical protein TRAPUB_2612 [Trametes pubescens]|uniref:Uncharacterized protein n=1 Tax=Trametes pubescens TaxID=154538 RepID=A0A1M2VG18_TRAPU|nr:hypothetical protein TRAPUB_2612 [Trametes pubescens]